MIMCGLLIAGTPAEQHFLKALEYYKSNDMQKCEAELNISCELEKDFKSSVELKERINKEKFINDTSDPLNDLVKEFYEKGISYYRKGEYKSALKEWKKH